MHNGILSAALPDQEHFPVLLQFRNLLWQPDNLLHVHAFFPLQDKTGLQTVDQDEDEEKLLMPYHQNRILSWQLPYQKEALYFQAFLQLHV